MAQKFRVVYNDETKAVIGFLADDLSKETHEQNSPEGVKVTDNVLTFDNDEEIITPDRVKVSDSGEAQKTEDEGE